MKLVGNLKECTCESSSRKHKVATVGPALPGTLDEIPLGQYFGDKIHFTCGGLVGYHPREDTDSVSGNAIARRLIDLGLIELDGTERDNWNY